MAGIEIERKDGSKPMFFKQCYLVCFMVVLTGLWILAIQKQGQEHDAKKETWLRSQSSKAYIFVFYNPPVHFELLTGLCSICPRNPEMTDDDVFRSYFWWYFKLVDHVKWYGGG